MATGTSVPCSGGSSGPDSTWRRHLLPAHSRRLLEIGYGSGVFMPELSRHTDELHGTDIHPYADAVGRSLRSQGVTATLVQASTSELPYDDGSFDCVVAISCLEFVDSIEDACAEIRRVLTPCGVAVVITPGTSVVLDLGLQLMTGERAEDSFQGRRQAVLPALRRHLGSRAERRFPRVPSVWLYTAFAGERPAD
jgi:ubiquinone/menaquinone biosynthesis C-methylase UbiE